MRTKRKKKGCETNRQMQLFFFFLSQAFNEEQTPYSFALGSTQYCVVTKIFPYQSLPAPTHHFLGPSLLNKQIDVTIF